MLTKKHYNTIASILFKYKSFIPNSLIKELSNFFEADNPKFNKTIFFNAIFPTAKDFKKSKDFPKFNGEFK